VKLVIDNSVVMRWLFKDGSDADRVYAGRVASLVESSEVHVPTLFIAEAANVISRALKAGVITRNDSAAYFDLINQMDAQVISPARTQDVTNVALKALDEGLSSYDATYLLLAERLACPLATLDKDLRRAAHRCGIPIACTTEG
jgi:predicted nucleic acid-binding protein